MDGLSSTLKSNGEAVLLGKRNNCLLVKDDVGRGKPTTRDLPKGQFTFGKPENRDAESAADGKNTLIAQCLFPRQNSLSKSKSYLSTPASSVSLYRAILVEE